MDKKIDQTIEHICDMVQKNKEYSVIDPMDYTSLISALAELLRANAEYKIASLQEKVSLENYSSSKSSNERIEL